MFEQFTVDQRLSKYQGILQVSQTDDDITPKLAQYGYVETVLQEGQSLYDAAYDLQQKQKKEYGEQFTATDAVTTTRQAAYTEYMKNAGLARIVFKRERGFLTQLDLVGERERIQDKLQMQMLRFYDNALGSPEILDKLSRFNMTAETLQAGKALVTTISEKVQSQNKEASEAQRATHDRDEAMAKLDDYMSDLIGVAKIALADQPEYLERLGIVDPS